MVKIDTKLVFLMACLSERTNVVISKQHLVLDCSFLRHNKTRKKTLGMSRYRKIFPQFLINCFLTKKRLSFHFADSRVLISIFELNLVYSFKSFQI